MKSPRCVEAPSIPPGAVSSLARLDPVMARVIERAGPFTLEALRLPPFESLVKAVVYQQLHGKAAATIFGRFLALFPGARFPLPDQLLGATPEQLRAAGLSRPKATYVRNIAEHTLQGGVPSLDECDRLGDAEILERLTRIKGVGRWTVEMMLIFNLGRPDVLPVYDLGVRRGFQIAWRKRRMPEPDELERHGRKWAPYRTVAAWYLWRVADQPAEA